MWSDNTKEKLLIVKHLLDDIYTKKWVPEQWIDSIPLAKAWGDFLVAEHKDVVKSGKPIRAYDYERWGLDEAWQFVAVRDFWPEFIAALEEDLRSARELLYIQVRFIHEYFSGIDALTGERRWNAPRMPLIGGDDWNHQIVFERNRYLTNREKIKIREAQKVVDVIGKDIDVIADKIGHTPGETTRETVKKVFEGERMAYAGLTIGLIAVAVGVMMQ